MWRPNRLASVHCFICKNCNISLMSLVYLTQSWLECGFYLDFLYKAKRLCYIKAIEGINWLLSPTLHSSVRKQYFNNNSKNNLADIYLWYNNTLSFLCCVSDRVQNTETWKIQRMFILTNSSSKENDELFLNLTK